LKTRVAEPGLEAYLAAARARVNTALDFWGQRLDEFWPPDVAAAIRYALLAPGKRLRPTLLFAAHDAVWGVGGAGSPLRHGETDAIAQIGAAVEVVHAYSLVHDDLPCMDDDDLRRGRPTTHRAFDVPTATRAGFHMVGLAARVLARGMERAGLPPARRREIAVELFRAAGASGMIGGQWLDLEAEQRRLSPAEMEDVHRRKTGALIAASCVIGGLAAGAHVPTGHLAGLREYGRAIGVAFQIADDVLDATATSAQLGKTAGKDAARAKSTFVTLLGVGAARAEAERLCALAVDRLRDSGLVSPTLVQLADFIVNRPN
jgi:geranylgeranyl pyrophosphate synthase